METEKYESIVQRIINLQKLVEQGVGGEAENARIAIERIAAYKLGFDFVGCEIDKGYYEAQEKRFQEECKDTVILTNGKQVKQLSIEL